MIVLDTDTGITYDMIKREPAPAPEPVVKLADDDTTLHTVGDFQGSSNYELTVRQSWVENDCIYIEVKHNYDRQGIIISNEQAAHTAALIGRVLEEANNVDL